MLSAVLAIVWLHAAQGVLRAAWFKRGDPNITTHLFVYRPHLLLFDRKLGVYPFVILQGGEPAPPDIAPLLTRALLQEGSAASVTHISEAPWDGTPPWESGRWRDASLVAAVAADGRERGFDFVVLGRVDRFFRTAADGLVAKVTLWLISTRDGAVVWHGAKHAEWLRRYALEECVIHLAWSFAIEWRPPPP